MKINIYAYSAKLRCKILAWMKEPEWKWYIVHTDWMRNLTPVIAPLTGVLTSLLSTAFGFNLFINEPNGPNN
tara:strand:+ start:235 stop:450 length:216 start_codon:yes stop_codon:yes gene_type:complete